MAGFANQAALRSHYEDLIDSTESDISEGLKNAMSWFKQVLIHTTMYYVYMSLPKNALFLFFFFFWFNSHDIL